MPDPEALARADIDRQLALAGWAVQDRKELNLFAGTGIALREANHPGAGKSDYLLIAGKKAIGIVEAKPRGTTLTGVELQTRVYAEGLPDHIPYWTLPLPMPYESTGIETRFTILLDPEPRSRQVFGFHRPETLVEWVCNGSDGAGRRTLCPPALNGPARSAAEDGRCTPLALRRSLYGFTGCSRRSTPSCG